MKRCPICVRSFPAQERFCSVHGLPLVEERLEIGDRAGDLSGQVLDHRYRLAGVAGTGGMGVVYEAENLRIGRRCAVKILHPHMHADEKMRMRLFREVQATSRIRHPNVVEILDYGHDDQAGAYLVMEFLEGRSLGQVIRDGPVPLGVVFKCAVQLTAALAATHSHGLIHRDLKPSNIRLLQSGVIKVLDFGLVKPFERAPGEPGAFVTISTGGIAFGTPWYMSPEQASFKSLDPRSDIYSLGVVFYELVTGRLPFEGDNPMEVIEAQMRAPVPLPSTLKPPVSLPAGLEMLLLKMLAKQREDRPQSMTEVMEEIYSLARSEGIGMGDLEVAGARPREPISDLPPAAMTGTVPEGEDDDSPETQPWTMPFAPSEKALDEVRALALQRLDGLVERIIAGLRDSIPRYRNLDAETLESAVRVLIETAIAYLGDDPPKDFPEELHKLVVERSTQRFTLTELVGALWMGYSMSRPILQEVAEKNIERYAALEDKVDQRILPLMLRMVDRYVAQAQGRMLALNETLARRNEELESLRNQLAERMHDAVKRLDQAEQLKARVADSVPSGLLLLERSSRRVLMFNKAMERISGVSASQVVDRAMDEVMHFVEGVPFEEFIEQIRIHGEVGLRKLRVRLPGGAERSVYVRGQTFYNAQMEATGTLFVVEDVTEREQIIESFGRYVSRDVVDRVLRRGQALKPGGEPRSAVLLAVNICNFTALVRELTPEGVVELLTDYLRVVGDAVFHQGGTIDTVVADGILVYFARLGQTCQPAVSAAVELMGRIEAVNEQRDAKGKQIIHAGIGIHCGEVLVLNVGGKQRMVHTVVGEAAQVALALRNVASGGEILVTPAVVEGCKDLQVESGPVVQVPGHDEPMHVLRVVFQTAPVKGPVTIQ